MKHNVLAVMALVNGLAQANRFSWQSESETDVGKYGHGYEHKSKEVFKAKEDEILDQLYPDWKDDKKGEEEKKQSELDLEKLKLLKEKLRDEEEEETEAEEKEYEHGHGYHKGHHDYNSYSADPKTYSTYDHYKPAVTGHYNNHHDAYNYKKPIIVDGKKYDYAHKPVTEHHTYTKIHEPTVKPDCHGDRCDRKPCNKCGDDWAQPGCWHCKNHEGDYGEETKTTKYAPEKTDDKYHGAKTYTHKGVTVVVPKETKAPEAPKIEKPKEQPKKEEKYEDICRKVIKGHGEHKYEETICDRVKHQKEEQPKKEHKHEDICRKVTKGHGEHKHEETICDRIKYQKEEQPKVYVQPKKEDPCKKVTKGHGEHKHEETICDRIKHQKEEHPKVYVEPKKEDICKKIKGCPAPAPQPHYEVKPVPIPAPAPAPQYPEAEPVPAPAPQPQYPKVEPVPAPAPAPPANIPVPAPVPVNPEQVQPQGEDYGEAPRVPLTVSKSGASFNTVSIASTIFVGIIGMMLL
jgi:hypothetical protein